MRLKYIGHRDIYIVTLSSKRYIFDERNHYEMDVPDKIADYMFHMSSGQFRVLPEIQSKEIKIGEEFGSKEAAQVEEKKIEEKILKRRGRPRKNEY